VTKRGCLVGVNVVTGKDELRLQVIVQIGSERKNLHTDRIKLMFH
jgi:hypothetical protein